MNERHLSDDRLIEMCVAGPAAPAERAHLAGCPRCELRRASIVQILADVDETATRDADAAFPPERLERQQARILQRIDQDGRPGRLVAFPASQPAGTLLLRTRPHARWAAAAAAAAFVAGLLTGHLAHDFTIARDPAPAHVIANDAGSSPLRAVSTTFSEDEFLGEIEQAAARNGPSALRPLDAMTPRAWDVR
jgi:hypothetical protein